MPEQTVQSSVTVVVAATGAELSFLPVLCESGSVCCESLCGEVSDVRVTLGLGHVKCTRTVRSLLLLRAGI